MKVTAANPPAACRAEPEQTGALSGLRRISRDDLVNYRQALDQTSRICWQQYFPFLYFYYGMSETQDLLIGEIDGSICTFRLDRRGEKPQLCVYFLPMPMNDAVLRRCLERVREFNGSERVMIYWVDAEDIGLLSGLWQPLRVFPIAQEYLYDPKIYRALSGKKMRELRHNLNRIASRNDVEVRPYAPGDVAACEALLDEWTLQQRGKYDHISYRRYTTNCLRHTDLFAPPDLFGKVVLIGGKLRSFGFAGEIRRGLANLFITYSDARINGLNRFLIRQFMLDLEACDLVNSAMADTPGLVAAKESLCPVAKHGMYRVHVGENK